MQLADEVLPTAETEFAGHAWQDNSPVDDGVAAPQEGGCSGEGLGEYVPAWGAEELKPVA